MVLRFDLAGKGETRLGFFDLFSDPGGPFASLVAPGRFSDVPCGGTRRRKSEMGVIDTSFWLLLRGARVKPVDPPF